MPPDKTIKHFRNLKIKHFFFFNAHRCETAKIYLNRVHQKCKKQNLKTAYCRHVVQTFYLTVRYMKTYCYSSVYCRFSKTGFTEIFFFLILLVNSLQIQLQLYVYVYVNVCLFVY